MKHLAHRIGAIFRSSPSQEAEVFAKYAGQVRNIAKSGTAKDAERAVHAAARKADEDERLAREADAHRKAYLESQQPVVRQDQFIELLKVKALLEVTRSQLPRKRSMVVIRSRGTYRIGGEPRYDRTYDGPVVMGYEPSFTIHVNGYILLHSPKNAGLFVGFVHGGGLVNFVVGGGAYKWRDQYNCAHLDLDTRLGIPIEYISSGDTAVLPSEIKAATVYMQDATLRVINSDWHLFS